MTGRKGTYWNMAVWLSALTLILTSCGTSDPSVEQAARLTTTTELAAQPATTTEQKLTDSIDDDFDDDPALVESPPATFTGEFGPDDATKVFDDFLEAEVTFLNLLADGSATIDDTRDFSRHFDESLFVLPLERREKELWKCNQNLDHAVLEIEPTHIDQFRLDDGVWVVQAALAVSRNGEPPSSAGVEFVITSNGYGGFIRSDDQSCGYELTTRGVELRDLAREVVAQEQAKDALLETPTSPLTAAEAMSIVDHHFEMEAAMIEATTSGTANFELATDYFTTRDTSLLVGNTELGAHLSWMCFEGLFGERGTLAGGPFSVEGRHVDQTQINESTWVIAMRFDGETVDGSFRNDWEHLVTSNGIGPATAPIEGDTCGVVLNDRGWAFHEDAIQALNAVDSE